MRKKSKTPSSGSLVPMPPTREQDGVLTLIITTVSLATEVSAESI